MFKINRLLMIVIFYGINLYAFGLFKQEKVLIDLNKDSEKFCKENKPLLNKQAEAIDMSKMNSFNVTQTESFLNVWFCKESDCYSVKNYDFLIKRILESEYCIERECVPKYVDLIDSMIEKERKYSDYYVFYHSFGAVAGFVFDVQSAIDRRLRLESVESNNLRLRFKCAKGYRDISDFLDCHENEIYCDNSFDHKESIREKILAVNLCPFGNTGDNFKGEGSFNFFVCRRGISDPIDVLSSLFDEFGFSRKYLDKLVLLYLSYIYDCPKYFDFFLKVGNNCFSIFNKSWYYKLFPDIGNMAQIFIPKDTVSDFVYLSHAYGVPLSKKYNCDYDEHKKRQESISWFLDKYINDPGSLVKKNEYHSFLEYDMDWLDNNNEKNLHVLGAKEVMNKSQARIVFMPDFYDKESGVKIFKYNFAREKNEKYEKEFNEIIDQMMSQWIGEKGYEKVIKAGDKNK